MGRLSAAIYTTRTSGFKKFDRDVYDALSRFDDGSSAYDTNIAPYHIGGLDPRYFDIELHEGQFRVYNRLGIENDQPYCFVLRNGKPVASLGFVPKNHRTTEMGQIQGVPGEIRTLSMLNWQQLLLDTWLQWSTKNGFREARILPAEESRWWNHGEEIDWFFDETELKKRVKEREQRQRRMEKLYDQNAEANGFTFDSEIRRYRLSL